VTERRDGAWLRAIFDAAQVGASRHCRAPALMCVDSPQSHVADSLRSQVLPSLRSHPAMTPSASTLLRRDAVSRRASDDCALGAARKALAN
jgi:hypothetical protein